MEGKPELALCVEALVDHDRRPAARAALLEAAQAGMDAIREGLSHPRWEVRWHCAMFLDGHWDVASLQRLVLTLYDPKRKVRRAATHSLGCDLCKGGENPIDVVPLLAERIREDKSVKVRRTAVMTLAVQRPDKRIARILRRALRDESDAKLRGWAHFGLKRYE